MSELKAGTIKTPYREGIAFVVDDTFYDKEEGETLFYLKSEADKVIEEKDEIIDELKEHIDELQKATDSAWSKVNAIYDELRHQKYKRCVAMAEWCEVTALWCYQAANTLPIGFRATLYGKPVMIEPSRLFERSARLNNWVNRWLALAEEPTWAKFLQLIHKETK